MLDWSGRRSDDGGLKGAIAGQPCFYRYSLRDSAASKTGGGLPRLALAARVAHAASSIS